MAHEKDHAADHATGGTDELTPADIGAATAGSGAPTTSQYVTLATDAILTAERVLTPGTGLDLTDGGAGAAVTLDVDLSEISAGGELSGNMDAPTVDATHSGSTHAATQAAAEATAAAANTADIATHAGLADPHTGYRLESADHTHQTTGLQAGTIAEAALALTDLTTGDVSTAKHGFTPKAPNDTAKFLRGDATWAVPTASVALTTAQVSLVAAPNARRSGHVQITGLSGLTAGKAVLVRQAGGPYTDKGTRTDEAEMDSLDLTGKVLDATTIDIYWTSRYRVRGNYKVDYLVSA